MKHIKSIISLLLCFALVMPFGIAFANDEQIQPDEKYLSEAQQVVEYIFQMSYTEDDDDRLPAFTQGTSATRGVFVDRVIKLLGITPPEAKDALFSDVDTSSPYADSIYAALSMNLVSEGDNFRPDDIITPLEALKIVTNAIGYDLMAQTKGGYPTGYLIVAKKLELDYEMDFSLDGLSYDYAYVLLYNMLKAELMDAVSYQSKDGSEIQGIFKQIKENILSQVYGIYSVEGRVSATPYNSLIPNGQLKQNHIAIEGEIFDCENVTYDMLGLNYEILLKQDRNGNYYSVMELPRSESIKVITFEDFIEKNGNSYFYYDENDSEKKFSLVADGCEYLYNGDKANEGIDKYLTGMVGEIEFFDNDDDGYADLVCVTVPEYAVVHGIDTYNIIIRDSNGTTTIDLSDSDNNYFVFDETGAPMHILDIKSGSALRVVRCASTGVTILTVVSESVTGEVKIPQDGYLMIGNREYIITDYFDANYMSGLGVGNTQKFIVDGKYIVSTTKQTSGYVYGYLFDADIKGGLNSCYEYKIFTTSNEFEIFECADKVTIDGENGNSAKVLYEKLCPNGVAQKQLIKYTTDSEGRLKGVDISETKSSGEYLLPKGDPDDALTKFDFGSSKYQYRNGRKILGNKFNISGTTVFKLPTDLTDEEGYYCGSCSMFADYETVTPELYDVSEYGAPGALIYYSSSKISLNNEHVPYVIDEVTRGMNDDGKSGYIIKAWQNNNYVTEFLPENIAFSMLKSGTPVKSTHPNLSTGSIIRIAKDKEGNIGLLEVIFDARKGVFATNTTSNVNINTIATPQYAEGQVYSSDGTFITLSGKYAGNGAYDIDMASMMTIDANTSNIMLYDCKTGKLRKAFSDDIKQYIVDGSKAHYAFIFQRAMVTYGIILYENAEVLR